MKVGSITVINLTGNTLSIGVNTSNVRKFQEIGELNGGTVTFEDESPSPVTDDGAGYTPSSLVFLRKTEDKQANYFHNGTNNVIVEVGGNEREYSFDISGKGYQALKNSATLTITRESFIVAAPDGEIWFQQYATEAETA